MSAAVDPVTIAMACYQAAHGLGQERSVVTVRQEAVQIATGACRDVP
jgi:hypothetical protein